MRRGELVNSDWWFEKFVISCLTKGYISAKIKLHFILAEVFLCISTGMQRMLSGN